MSPNMPIFEDEPIDNAELLGHSKIISGLENFLNDKNLRTPLSIAIHGDWGRGKTSVMKTLARKLDKNKFNIVFFDAWKYEYTNPSLALISQITKKYKNNENWKKIMKTAMYVLSNKFLNSNINEITNLIHDTEDPAESISSEIKHLTKTDNKKLLILIDDMDRCNVENTFKLLSLMKLFLDVENCICIAAVDFNHLKQVWKQKYKIENNKEDKNVADYLDKIFQIRITIPLPPAMQIEDYIVMLYPNIQTEIKNLCIEFLPRNPRSIKRFFNLVAYRKNLINNKNTAIAAIFWTMLEEILGNKDLITMYEILNGSTHTLGDLLISNLTPNDLGDILAWFCKDIFLKHQGSVEGCFQLFGGLIKKNKLDNVSASSWNNTFADLAISTNELVEYGILMFYDKLLD
jgi:uridine kinase